MTAMERAGVGGETDSPSGLAEPMTMIPLIVADLLWTHGFLDGTMNWDDARTTDLVLSNLSCFALIHVVLCFQLDSPNGDNMEIRFG